MKVTLASVRTAAAAAASVAAFCRSVIAQGIDAATALATHMTTVATESKALRIGAEKLYVSFSKEANAAESTLRLRATREKDEKGNVTSIAFEASDAGKIRKPRQPNGSRSRDVAPTAADVSKAQTVAAEAGKRADSLADQLRRLELALSHMGLSAERIAAIRSGSADPISARHVPAATRKPAAATAPAPAAVPAAPVAAKPKPNRKPRQTVAKAA